MKARTLTTLALVAVAAAACKKGDNANGSDSSATKADTSVVQGTDTMQKTVNQVVPTSDTVVQKTTTNTSTDTIKGGADTTHKDTTKKM